MISKNISTRVCKKIFLIRKKNKKNHFILGVPKVLSVGVNKNFREKNCHRGISNQKLRKVKNFQVWIALRLFE